jgi:parallel beta-helix repeat protein
VRSALIVFFLLFPLPAWSLILTTNTQWSGEQSFSETVRVEPGVVLTVAPGTVVTFSGGRLEIAGRLEARGARFTGRDWEGIILKGCDAATVLAGCIVEGARTGIFVGGGAPKLERLRLEKNDVGVEIKQKSAAVIENCVFLGNARVGLFIKDEAAPQVTGNLFAGNGKFGVYIYRALPRVFSKNVLTGNPTGLMISHYGSDPVIEGNRFEKNGVAIFVDRAARPHLQGNLLRGNETALRLYRRSDPRIEGNRLSDNGVAISVAYSSYPVIAGNDFTGNGSALTLEFQSSTWEAEKGSAARQEEVSSRGAFGQGPRSEVTEKERRPRDLDGTVDARGNWWGPQNTAELERIGVRGNPSFFADGRDTPTFDEGGKAYPLDTVRFAPWSGVALTTNLEKLP